MPSHPRTAAITASSPTRRSIWIAAQVLAWLAAAALPAPALAAGVREPAIGIDFPERLGDFALKGRKQFPQAGEGATIAYEHKDARGAIYVYNAGLAAIPAGVGSPVVHRHFQETAAALQRAGAESSVAVKPLQKATVSSFKGCGPQFMWRSDEMTIRGSALMSRTYLTGFNNHFVKLRVTHPRAGAAEAEDFVQQVRRVLGNCR